MNIYVKILLFITLISNSLPDRDCTIISQILRNKEVLSYLHPELKDRSKLYISKNELCDTSKKIGDIELIVIDEKDLKDTKNYIEIVSIKESSIGKIISISYPIEGAIYTIHFDNSNNIFKVEIIEK